MNSNKMANILRLLGVGWYVAICIGGGAIAGVLLDSKLDTQPILTLACVISGVIVAGIGMYRMILMVVSNKVELDGKK